MGGTGLSGIKMSSSTIYYVGPDVRILATDVQLSGWLLKTKSVQGCWVAV